MCEFLSRNLQEITIDVTLHLWGVPGPSDLAKFEPLLKPLERLSGLKSAIVKGVVTEAYGAKLKMILENDGVRRYKKRKVGTDSEEEVVLRPRKKRIT